MALECGYEPARFVHLLGVARAGKTGSTLLLRGVCSCGSSRECCCEGPLPIECLPEGAFCDGLLLYTLYCDSESFRAPFPRGPAGLRSMFFSVLLECEGGYLAVVTSRSSLRCRYWSACNLDINLHSFWDARAHHR